MPSVFERIFIAARCSYRSLCHTVWTCGVIQFQQNKLRYESKWTDWWLQVCAPFDVIQFLFWAVSMTNMSIVNGKQCGKWIQFTTNGSLVRKFILTTFCGCVRVCVMTRRMSKSIWRIPFIHKNVNEKTDRESDDRSSCKQMISKRRNVTATASHIRQDDYIRFVW